MLQIPRILIAVAAVFLVLSGPLLAHGTKKHEEPKSALPVDAEQMPWGIAGSVDQIGRTIEVSMLDKMRFNPASLTIKMGETIRFKVKNKGMVLHEFVLGTRAANDEHAALMMRFPGMEHDSPYMAHVESGGTGEIVWTFNEPGEFEFACLIAGHYQAGMIGSLKVLAN